MKRVARSLVVVAGVLALLFVPSVRHAVLRGAGATLVAGDVPRKADTITADIESGPAGALEAFDLYTRGFGTAILVLDDYVTPLETELARRGVRLPDPRLETLRQLGVPPRALTHLDAGEGGTTDSTGTLARWAAAHPERRLLVVVGAAHTRRFRRTLARRWPAGVQSPIVVSTSHDEFRPDTWWLRRRTLRVGLVELEKLALDVVLHPF